MKLDILTIVIILSISALLIVFIWAGITDYFYDRKYKKDLKREEKNEH